MNCHELEPLLADLLGGELDDQERRAAEEHLSACPACRAEVADLRRTAGLLLSLDTVDPSDAARRASVLQVVRRRSPSVRLIYAGLRSAAFVAMGVWLGWTWAAGKPGAPMRETTHTAYRSELDLNLGPVHPSWKDRATELAPNPSSFARNLGLIAHSRSK